MASTMSGRTKKTFRHPDPLPGRGGEGIERDRHSHVETKAITEPMQQGADVLFRGRILPGSGTCSNCAAPSSNGRGPTARRKHRAQAPPGCRGCGSCSTSGARAKVGLCSLEFSTTDRHGCARMFRFLYAHQWFFLSPGNMTLWLRVELSDPVPHLTRPVSTCFALRQSNLRASASSRG